MPDSASPERPGAPPGDVTEPEQISVTELPSAPSEPEETASRQPDAGSGVFATQVQSVQQSAAAARGSKTGTTFTIPGYEILSELGRGGMGVVYKAVQTRLKRVVALKMILSGAQAGATDESRFRTEVEAVARLQHPNIVQVYEVGSHDGKSFCSLEFLEGGSLDRRLKGEPQPAPLAARITETLADAMEAAHRSGIVHRDLKPANVLLGGAPGAPLEQCTPKICDFGLAKRLDDDSHQTRSGAILGTPSFMAPEQAEGRVHEIGPASDVYALGAILYDLLTGRPPFKGATVFDTLEQVRSREPVPPSQLQPKVPRDLETICLKCLHKDPRRRYASARDLAEDLHRFRNNEPILARPTGNVERLLKWARRRPAVAALLVVVVVAVVGVVGGVLYAAESQRRAAELDRKLAEQRLEGQEQRERTRGKVRGLVKEAQGDMARESWDDANQALSNAEQLIASDAELDEMRPDVDDLRKQVNGRRDQQANHKRFNELRDEALFHATLSIGEDLAANLRATAEKARAALALYGIRTDTDTPPVIDPALKPDEREEIRNNCYLLLLVLADAVGQPRPGQTEKELAGSAEDALRILRRADRFGLDTQAGHRRRARYLSRLGKKDEATAEARKAAGHAPTLALDYYLVGDDYYKEGDLEEAARHFENVLALKPGDFWARYYLAVCYVRVGRAAEARAFLTSCLSQRKDFVWLYLMRGFANNLLKDNRAAEDDFRHAADMLTQTPNNEGLYALYTSRAVLRYRQKEIASAVDDLRRAIEIRPGRYQAHLTLAQIYQTQAAEDFKHVLPVCPAPYQVCAVLGQLWQGERNRDEALRHFNEAIRLEKDSVFLYRNRARLHLERNDLERALADFEEAARKASADPTTDPHDLARLRVECAKVLLLRKRYPEALRACDAACAAWPQFADAYLYRAKALLELPADDEAQRTRSYQEAVASLASYQRTGGRPRAEVYLARAQALARLHEYPKAIEAYTLAIELRPRDAALHAARGWLHLATRAPDLARNDFDQAIALNPRDADAYNGRGHARVTEGDYKRAVADADEAVRLGGDNARFLMDAARTYGLAMSHADEEVARLPPLTKLSEVEAARRLRTEYGRKAVGLLARALRRLPEAERAAFWRERVMGDSALALVRQSDEFRRLRAEYGGVARK
jgi:tetratricopeptide (TPR) repeat protein